MPKMPKMPKMIEKCDKIRELIPLYLATELSGAERETLEAHLLSCERCAKQLEMDRSLQDVLESYRSAEIPRDVELRFTSNLYKNIALDAIKNRGQGTGDREQEKSFIFHFPFSNLLSRRPPLWASGVTAICTLLFGLLMGASNLMPIFLSLRLNRGNVGTSETAIKEKTSETETRSDATDATDAKLPQNFDRLNNQTSQIEMDTNTNLNYEQKLGRIAFIRAPQDESALEQLRSANFFHYVLRDYRRALSEYKNISDRYAGSQVAEEAQKQIKKLQKAQELASL